MKSWASLLSAISLLRVTNSLLWWSLSVATIFLLLETKYIVYMNTDLCYNNDSYKSALINEL